MVLVQYFSSSVLRKCCTNLLYRPPPFFSDRIRFSLLSFPFIRQFLSNNGTILFSLRYVIFGYDNLGFWNDSCSLSYFLENVGISLLNRTFPSIIPPFFDLIIIILLIIISLPLKFSSNLQLTYISKKRKKEIAAFYNALLPSQYSKQ